MSNVSVPWRYLVHSAGQVSDVALPDADVARGVEGEVGAGVEARQLGAGRPKQPCHVKRD